MRTQLLSLLVAAAAGLAALLPGTASAQQYRGYSRAGSYTPGNYGMTRPTGYAPSNYGMMRPSGYTPSNFGNLSASIPYNARDGRPPASSVPVGALTTLPGIPVGPYLNPATVSSFPPIPAPAAGTPASGPGPAPRRRSPSSSRPAPRRRRPPIRVRCRPRPRPAADRAGRYPRGPGRRPELVGRFRDAV